MGRAFPGSAAGAQHFRRIRIRSHPDHLAVSHSEYVRDRRFVLTAGIVACFLALFLLVYLAGYFSLESGQAVQQYWKGFIKFGIHFLFLLLGVVYLSRRSAGFYLRTIGF